MKSRTQPLSHVLLAIPHSALIIAIEALRTRSKPGHEAELHFSILSTGRFSLRNSGCLLCQGISPCGNSHFHHQHIAPRECPMYLPTPFSVTIIYLLNSRYFGSLVFADKMIKYLVMQINQFITSSSYQ